MSHHICHPQLNPTKTMSILLLGASRNIGHHVAHILLHDSSPSTSELKLTLLLRNDLPADDSLTPFIHSGRVTIVRGDAMLRADVERAFLAAGGAQCRAVVYTVGAPPAERSFGSVRSCLRRVLSVRSC